MTKHIKSDTDLNQQTVPNTDPPITTVADKSDVIHLQQQIALLTEHINFIYKYLGITSSADSRSDNRRTETGMGAFINSKSDFV